MTQTVTVNISADEWHPVFDIQEPTSDGSGHVEIPKELLDRYTWAQAEWEQVQGELREYSNFEPEPFNGYIY